MAMTYGVVDTEGQAGAVAVQAVIDLHEKQDMLVCKNESAHDVHTGSALQAATGAASATMLERDRLR